MSKTAIIYLRVSSAQQARKELPVESQLKCAQAKAKELGATVLAIFTDSGISGRTDKREDFQAAIAYCERYTPDYFIAWDTSRFARNRIDASLYKRDLRALGTDVVYVSMSIDSKTDEGWFMEALMEVMDESTSRRISKDTKRSMMKNAAEGYFNGGRAPYGYTTVRDGQRSRLAIEPDEAETVRKIFRLVATGAGATTIAYELNQAQQLKRGKPWVKSSIIYLLKNHVYAGYSIFNRRRHHSKIEEPEDVWIRTQSHDPIIEEESFMKIQRLISERSQVKAGGAPRSHHLFTGMLRCRECGHGMQIESGTGRTAVYHYYKCGKAKIGQCDNVKRLSAPAVDEIVAQTILDEILTVERVSTIIGEIQKETSEWWRERDQKREGLVRELRLWEKKQKNLFGLLELHGVDAPNLGDITLRLREIKAEMLEIESHLVRLESIEDPDLDLSPDAIAEATETLRTLVTESEDPIAVRTFFASFVKTVTWERERLVIKYLPSKLMNHGFSVVHSENSWLPDLDSNQGPAD